MSKKKELVYKNKNIFDDVDKSNFTLTGYCQASNYIKRKLALNYHVNAAYVYDTIVSHRNTNEDKPEYNQCFPSVELLMRETGLSEDTVEKCIKTLADEGYIIIHSGKTGLANQYYFPKEPFYKGEGSKAKRRTNKKVIEEISANENNIVVENIIIPVSTGECFDFEEEIEEIPVIDNKVKEFESKGKYIDVDNDLFVEYIEEIIKVENNSFTGDDVVNDFYINMHSYFDVNDDLLKINKTIIKKVNDLVEFINAEFVNNKIENVKAEKIINDIMKNNQKSFNNALNSKNITDDFKKCTYVISCVQNNFKDKKLKTIINNKVDKLPIVDDSFVDYMNDNFISLPNGENLNKKEAIERITLIIGKEEKFIKDIANDIVRKVAKFYNTTFNSFEECSMPMFKDIINELNKFYKHEILMDDRFDGIIIQDISDMNIAI